MTRNILIIGPLLSESGYGNHSRQIFKYIDSLNKNNNINIFSVSLPWGNSSWILKDENEEDIIQKIQKSNINFDLNNKNVNNFDICIHISVPNEFFKHEKYSKYIGVTAGIEADFCHESWLDKINLCDKLITPSEFSKNSIINGFKNKNKKIETKIEVIPEWYGKEFENKEIEELKQLDIISEKNVFLINGQITSVNFANDRKNSYNLIKAIDDSFTKEDSIAIVLKTNIGSFSSIYKNKLYENLKTNLNLKNISIYLVNGNLSTSELNSLYRSKKIDCFISGSRGEGFGLCFLEAAICELPIIANNWSAYTEFLNNKFIKVDYTLDETNFEINDLFTKQMKWSNFVKEDLILKIKDFIKNKEHYRKQSHNLSLEIKQKYNSNYIIDNIYKKLDLL